MLGAGTIGTSIADMLCQEGHSVTVVDNDPAHTRRVNDELDVRVVTGSASESAVLFQAGVLGADLCLAVTGSDEVNLVAASMAKAMGTGRAVAWVYGPIFRDPSTFDYLRHFKIDRLVSMEHLTAMELAREIRHPGASSVETFARGELEMQELLVDEKAPVAIKDLVLPSGVRIGSIRHEGRLALAGAMDRVAPGDQITLIGTREDIDEVKGRFQREQPPKQGVVIAGGGETGYHLAQVIEKGRLWTRTARGASIWPRTWRTPPSSTPTRSVASRWKKSGWAARTSSWHVRATTRTTSWLASRPRNSGPRRSCRSSAGPTTPTWSASWASTTR